jgi:hypothetical protein
MNNLKNLWNEVVFYVKPYTYLNIVIDKENKQLTVTCNTAVFTYNLDKHPIEWWLLKFSKILERKFPTKHPYKWQRCNNMYPDS